MIALKVLENYQEVRGLSSAFEEWIVKTIENEFTTIIGLLNFLLVTVVTVIVLLYFRYSVAVSGFFYFIALAGCVVSVNFYEDRK